jgi:hypothetical protein
MGAPEPANVAVYYRWRDVQGLEHVVDSLEKVPEASRASAERVALATSAKKEPPPSWRGSMRIDWPSFTAGLATACALGLLFALARRAKKPLLELAVLVAAAAVIAGVYFGWVEQKSDRPSANTPPVQIDDSTIVPDKPMRKPTR